MTSYSLSKWGIGALLGVSFWGFTTISDASAQQGRRRGNAGQAQTQTAPAEGAPQGKDVPKVGSELNVDVRFTTTAFDQVVFD